MSLTLYNTNCQKIRPRNSIDTKRIQKALSFLVQQNKNTNFSQNNRNRENIIMYCKK